MSLVAMHSLPSKLGHWIQFEAGISIVRRSIRERSRLRRLARSFGKRPEELERANLKVIASFVVLPGLAEADEAEGPARASADREVADRETAVQVFVVLPPVNDLPRALAPVV